MNTTVNKATAIAPNQTPAKAAPQPAQPFGLALIIEAIFAPTLRGKIDADTAGDKSDAAYTWGM